MKRFTILILILLLIPIPLESAPLLTDGLKGKILLQVEELGQAWYVYPENKERIFLGRPADAFRIMRELGLGIGEIDYHSFNGYAPAWLSGRILLRVENNGEAYYVYPDNLKMYYLGRPADAFRIMRELGLGISNEDLDKIAVFQNYNEQTGQKRLISEIHKSLPENEYSAINKIIIPKIGVDAPITESESADIGLASGMWRMPNSSTPDQGRNTVITGHRWKYLPPSKKTFYLLDKMETDDIITVIWEKNKYSYRVRETKIVDKTAVHILSSTDEPILTLYTCHPVYSTENRFVVVADLISS